MPVEPDEFIRWQLKCLSEHAYELTDKQLNLVISFEEQFKRKGTLTECQQEILRNIYLKHA